MDENEDRHISLVGIHILDGFSFSKTAYYSAIFVVKGLFIAVVAVISPVQAAPSSDNLEWSSAGQGTVLSLENRHLTFDEEFDHFDCVDGLSGRLSGIHKWYSYGHFGFSRFASCQSKRNRPFRLKDGALEITLSRDSSGWKSGSIASVSPGGEGFKQRFGVFEARICLPAAAPPGVSVWPAFWLLSRYLQPDVAAPYTEMDILENFGENRSRIYSTFHRWSVDHDVSSAGHESSALRTDADLYDGKWHIYSLVWEPRMRIVYRDRVEIGRIVTTDDDDAYAMYPLVDLALFRAPSDEANVSYSIKVDWVRVYQ